MRRTVIGEAPPIDAHTQEPGSRGADVAWHATLSGQIRARARTVPDSVAIEQGNQSITYSALIHWADEWSARLTGAGVRAGDRVALRLARTPELIAVMLGTMGCGAAYVPLDPGYPAQRLQQMLDDAQVGAVVDVDPSAEGGRAVLSPVQGFGSKGLATRAAVGSDVAYVLYTSGSTGQPKGVELTHDGAVDMLMWASEVFGDDLRRVLASTSICFDCSILEIFGPLAVGGTTVLAAGPLAIGSTAEATGVALLHSVPSVIDELLRDDHLPASVRTAIVGGEAVWTGLVDAVYRKSSITRLVNLYGPTEYTSYATMAVLEPQLDGVPPIGRPVANTRIDLLDAAGEPVGAGETGEIVISGAGLARGYLRRPGQTAERFIPEPAGAGARAYRTGDLGYWAEGQLQFAGRMDDQVKVRGVRIEPAEVERALLLHPGVHEVVVLADAGPTCSSVETPVSVLLTAHVVADIEISSDPSGLRQFLAEVLPPSMLPTAYQFAQRLPRLPNGKVDRSLLRRSASPVAVAGTRPARSAVEATLVRLWAEALSVTTIDPDADLFDLGSHSLTALAVRARAERELGMTIPVEMLFGQSTVADIAASVVVLLATTGRSAGPVPDLGSETVHGVLSPTQTVLLDRGDPSLMLVSRLVGPVRLAALHHALITVQIRHSLLTSVVDSTSTPKRWRPGRLQPPVLVDASGLDSDSALLTARRAIDDVVDRGWDLHREGPSRWAIVRLAHDDHLLVAALHPVAADPWSIETLGHQVLELYALSIHARPAGPGSYAQYSELAAERHRPLSTAEGARQRRFWTTEMAGAPALCPPRDRSRQAVPPPAVTEVFDLNHESASSIDQLARESRATPQMVVVALHALALHVWTGQLDITIGCPTSGRPLAEHATVVGPAGDAIAIRCRLRRDMTLTEIVAQVRDVAIVAYGCDAVPFVELASSAITDHDRHPVYQTSAVLLARPSLLDPGYSAEIIGRQPVGTVELLPFGQRPSVTALDVELGLYPREGVIEGVALGRGDVVSQDDLAQYCRYFAEVAAGAMHDREQTVSTWSTKLQEAFPVPW